MTTSTATKTHQQSLTHRRSIFREFWREFLIVLVGLAAANAIFISKAFRQSTTVGSEAAARLGSFVGGYVGSLFALIGVVLLFATLRAQKRSSEIQSFENRYFELIKLHRANVAEGELGEASGRKLFVLILREFRCILEVVRRVSAFYNPQLGLERQRQIAYYCLFYGVGPNSSRMLKSSLTDFDPSFVDAIEAELNKETYKVWIEQERKLGYKPFEGHQSRLGHYYRHLFQMVRYVAESTLNIDKYGYMKTIRAQLSTHEQALLLINSRTPLGQVWWEKNLILDYSLVKNLPRDFFSSTEFDMNAILPKGYFEWEQNEELKAAKLV